MTQMMQTREGDDGEHPCTGGNLPAGATAAAQIETVFPFLRRGLVLVLQDGWRGKVHGGGLVRSERGTSPISGPEFVDGRNEDGSRFAKLAVVATSPSAADWFQAGDCVLFYQSADVDA